MNLTFNQRVFRALIRSPVSDIAAEFVMEDLEERALYYFRVHQEFKEIME